jgi:hypothetical protein
MNWSETAPYSFKLRGLVDYQLTDAKYTEKEILDSIMAIVTQREIENSFDNTITKDIYFTIVYDILTNLLFKKNHEHKY